MEANVESLFPLAAGVMLILLLAGTLFVAPLPVSIALTGVLFFGAGLFFGRPGGYRLMSAGISLVAPFTLMAVFLIVKFGYAFLMFPLLSSGGVGAGFAVRRRFPGGTFPFVLGAVWIVIVVLMALVIAPGRVRLPGVGPQN